MDTNRSDILNQLASGDISADEAARLLGAPLAGSRAPSLAAAHRWLRVRVTDLDTGRQKVNVNLPLAWVEVGLKIGAQYETRLAGIDLGELMAQIQSGAQGRIVEVEDLEDGERVEVFVD